MECYAMVLLGYVYINQWACVTPPSRRLIERAFKDADLNSDGQLNQGEFSRLFALLATRGAARVAMSCAINVVFCPLLACYFVTRLDLVSCVPHRLRPHVGSAAFLQTALTILFAYTVGGLAVSLLNRAIDRLQLRSLLRATSREAYERMRRMQHGRERRVRRAIASVAAFDSLTEKQRKRVRRAMTTLVFESGETIFEQGGDGDMFYVLVTGSAEVRRREPGGTAALTIAHLGPGSCFGERALLRDEPRYADVVASTAATAMSLSRAEFDGLKGHWK